MKRTFDENFCNGRGSLSTELNRIHKGPPKKIFNDGYLGSNG